MESVSIANPNEAVLVTLDIGDVGSSVSLAGANQGATLHVTLGDGSGSNALVTSESLTTSSAHFVTSTGASGEVSYLAVTRTG